MVVKISAAQKQQCISADSSEEGRWNYFEELAVKWLLVRLKGCKAFGNKNVKTIEKPTAAQAKKITANFTVLKADGSQTQSKRNIEVSSTCGH